MTNATKKIISLITLACFVMTQSVSANPGAGLQISPKFEKPSFLQIDIPSELATLDGLYEAPPRSDPRLILHIQNAHANYDAQMKIKQLIEYLHKTYAFQTIFVEGAVEELDPDALKMFPDDARNQKLADLMARQGELNGVELFILSENEQPGLVTRTSGLDKSSRENESRVPSPESHTEGPVRAFGIERADLYRENYEALKKVFGAEPAVSKYLSGYEARLDTLASKVFTPDLRRVLSEWKKFEKGRREFMPFIHSLALEAKGALNLDLESVLAQVEWPQITRLMVLQNLEKDLNVEKALAEKDALIAFLKGKQVSPDLFAAIKEFQGQRVSVLRGQSDSAPAGLQPRDLMEKLVTEAGPQGFKFNDYPQFSTYAGYLILKNELDPKGLFEEIKTVFSRILDALASTPRQKELVGIYRDEELVRKLLNLELPRKEWQEVDRTRDTLGMDVMVERLKAVGAALSKEYGLPLSNFETKKVNAKFREEVTAAQAAAYSFYEAAHKREDVFYEKINDVMTRGAVSKAILVTGGFHTDGITDLLREHQTSYGILTPRLIEKSNDKMYRKNMLQTQSSLFDLATLELFSKMQPVLEMLEQGAKLDAELAEELENINAVFQLDPKNVPETVEFLKGYLARRWNLDLSFDWDETVKGGGAWVVSFAQNGNAIGIPEQGETKAKKLTLQLQPVPNSGDLSITPKLVDAAPGSEVISMSQITAPSKEAVTKGERPGVDAGSLEKTAGGPVAPVTTQPSAGRQETRSDIHKPQAQSAGRSESRVAPERLPVSASLLHEQEIRDAFSELKTKYPDIADVDPDEAIKTANEDLALQKDFRPSFRTPLMNLGVGRRIKDTDFLAAVLASPYKPVAVVDDHRGYDVRDFPRALTALKKAVLLVLLMEAELRGYMIIPGIPTLESARHSGSGDAAYAPTLVIAKSSKDAVDMAAFLTKAARSGEAGPLYDNEYGMRLGIPWYARLAFIFTKPFRSTALRIESQNADTPAQPAETGKSVVRSPKRASAVGAQSAGPAIDRSGTAEWYFNRLKEGWHVPEAKHSALVAIGDALDLRWGDSNPGETARLIDGLIQFYEMGPDREIAMEALKAVAKRLTPANFGQSIVDVNPLVRRITDIFIRELAGPTDWLIFRHLADSFPRIAPRIFRARSRFLKASEAGADEAGVYNAKAGMLLNALRDVGAQYVPASRREPDSFMALQDAATMDTAAIGGFERFLGLYREQFTDEDSEDLIDKMKFYLGRMFYLARRPDLLNVALEAREPLFALVDLWDTVDRETKAIVAEFERPAGGKSVFKEAGAHAKAERMARLQALLITYLKLTEMMLEGGDIKIGKLAELYFGTDDALALAAGRELYWLSLFGNSIAGVALNNDRDLELRTKTDFRNRLKKFLPRSESRGRNDLADRSEARNPLAKAVEGMLAVGRSWLADWAEIRNLRWIEYQLKSLKYYSSNRERQMERLARLIAAIPAFKNPKTQARAMATVELAFSSFFPDVTKGALDKAVPELNSRKGNDPEIYWLILKKAKKPEIIRQAVDGLAGMKKQEIFNQLIETASTPEVWERVAHHVPDFLGMETESALEKRMQNESSRQQAIVAALGLTPEIAIPLIVSNQERDRRGELAPIFKARYVDSCVPVLMDLGRQARIYDYDGFVDQTLGLIGTEAAIEALIQRAQRSLRWREKENPADPEIVRLGKEVATAPVVVASIENVLKASGDPSTRQRMLDLLSQIGPNAAPAIPTILGMIDSELSFTVKALSRIGTPEALTFISEHGLASTDPRVVWQTANALLGAPADHLKVLVPDLLALLSAGVESENEVGYVGPVLEALAGSGAPEALTQIRKFQQNQRYESHVRKALAAYSAVTQDLGPLIDQIKLEPSDFEKLHLMIALDKSVSDKEFEVFEALYLYFCETYQSRYVYNDPREIALRAIARRTNKDEWAAFIGRMQEKDPALLKVVKAYAERNYMDLALPQLAVLFPVVFALHDDATAEENETAPRGGEYLLGDRGVLREEGFVHEYGEGKRSSVGIGNIVQDPAELHQIALMLGMNREPSFLWSGWAREAVQVYLRRERKAGDAFEKAEPFRTSMEETFSGLREIIERDPAMRELIAQAETNHGLMVRLTYASPEERRAFVSQLKAASDLLGSAPGCGVLLTLISHEGGQDQFRTDLVKQAQKIVKDRNFVIHLFGDSALTGEFTVFLTGREKALQPEERANFRLRLREAVAKWRKFESDHPETRSVLFLAGQERRRQYFPEAFMRATPAQREEFFRQLREASADLPGNMDLLKLSTSDSEPSLQTDVLEQALRIGAIHSSSAAILTTHESAWEFTRWLMSLDKGFEHQTPEKIQKAARLYQEVLAAGLSPEQAKTIVLADANIPALTTGMPIDGRSMRTEDLVRYIRTNRKFQLPGYFEIFMSRLFYTQYIGNYFKSGYRVDPAQAQRLAYENLGRMTLKRWKEMIAQGVLSGNYAAHRIHHAFDYSLEQAILESGYLIPRETFETLTQALEKENVVTDAIMRGKVNPLGRTDTLHTTINETPYGALSEPIFVALPVEVLLENHASDGDPLLRKGDWALKGYSRDVEHASHRIQIRGGVMCVPVSKQQRFEALIEKIQSENPDWQPPDIFYYKGEQADEGSPQLRAELGEPGDIVISKIPAAIGELELGSWNKDVYSIREGSLRLEDRARLTRYDQPMTQVYTDQEGLSRKQELKSVRDFSRQLEELATSSVKAIGLKLHEANGERVMDTGSAPRGTYHERFRGLPDDFDLMAYIKGAFPTREQLQQLQAKFVDEIRKSATQMVFGEDVALRVAYGNIKYDPDKGYALIQVDFYEGTEKNIPILTVDFVVYNTPEMNDGVRYQEKYLENIDHLLSGIKKNEGEAAYQEAKQHVLTVIRTTKEMYKNEGAYKRWEGGLRGVGTEQLVMQMNGVEDLFGTPRTVASLAVLMETFTVDRVLDKLLEASFDDGSFDTDLAKVISKLVLYDPGASKPGVNLSGGFTNQSLTRLAGLALDRQDQRAAATRPESRGSQDAQVEAVRSESRTGQAVQVGLRSGVQVHGQPSQSNLVNPERSEKRGNVWHRFLRSKLVRILLPPALAGVLGYSVLISSSVNRWFSGSDLLWFVRAVSEKVVVTPLKGAGELNIARELEKGLTGLSPEDAKFMTGMKETMKQLTDKGIPYHEALPILEAKAKEYPRYVSEVKRFRELERVRGMDIPADFPLLMRYWAAMTDYNIEKYLQAAGISGEDHAKASKILLRSTSILFQTDDLAATIVRVIHRNPSGFEFPGPEGLEVKIQSQPDGMTFDGWASVGWHEDTHLLHALQIGVSAEAGPWRDRKFLGASVFNTLAKGIPTGKDAGHRGLRTPMELHASLRPFLYGTGGGESWAGDLDFIDRTFSSNGNRERGAHYSTYSEGEDFGKWLLERYASSYPAFFVARQYESSNATLDLGQMILAGDILERILPPLKKFSELGEGRNPNQEEVEYLEKWALDQARNAGPLYEAPLGKIGEMATKIAATYSPKTPAVSSLKTGGAETAATAEASLSRSRSWLDSLAYLWKLLKRGLLPGLVIAQVVRFFAPLLSKKKSAEGTEGTQDKVRSEARTLLAKAGLSVAAAGLMAIAWILSLGSEKTPGKASTDTAAVSAQLLIRGNLDRSEYERIRTTDTYSKKLFGTEGYEKFAQHKQTPEERAFLSSILSYGRQLDPEGFGEIVSSLKSVILLEYAPKDVAGGNGYSLGEGKGGVVALSFPGPLPAVTGENRVFQLFLFFHETSHALQGTDELGARKNTRAFVEKTGLADRDPKLRQWEEEERFMIDMAERAEKGTGTVWNYYWGNGSTREQALRPLLGAKLLLGSEGVQNPTYLSSESVVNGFLISFRAGNNTVSLFYYQENGQGILEDRVSGQRLVINEVGEFILNGKILRMEMETESEVPTRSESRTPAGGMVTKSSDRSESRRSQLEAVRAELLQALETAQANALSSAQGTDRASDFSSECERMRVLLSKDVDSGEFFEGWKRWEYVSLRALPVSIEPEYVDGKDVSMVGGYALRANPEVFASRLMSDGYFVQRFLKDKRIEGRATYRVSLGNVFASRKLINILDAWLETSSAQDDTGAFGTFLYKVPFDIDHWFNRRDPVTVYLWGRPSDEALRDLYQKLVSENVFRTGNRPGAEEMAFEDPRGDLVRAKEVSEEDVQTLNAEVKALDEELGLAGVMSKEIALEYGKASAGDLMASKAVLKALRQRLNSGDRSEARDGVIVNTVKIHPVVAELRNQNKLNYKARHYKDLVEWHGHALSNKERMRFLSPLVRALIDGAAEFWEEYQKEEYVGQVDGEDGLFATIEKLGFYHSPQFVRHVVFPFNLSFQVSNPTRPGQKAGGSPLIRLSDKPRKIGQWNMNPESGSAQAEMQDHALILMTEVAKEGLSVFRKLKLDVEGVNGNPLRHLMLRVNNIAASVLVRQVVGKSLAAAFGLLAMFFGYEGRSASALITGLITGVISVLLTRFTMGMIGWEHYDKNWKERFAEELLTNAVSRLTPEIIQENDRQFDASFREIMEQVGQGATDSERKALREVKKFVRKELSPAGKYALVMGSLSDMVSKGLGFGVSVPDIAVNLLAEVATHSPKDFARLQAELEASRLEKEKDGAWGRLLRGFAFGRESVKDRLFVWTRLASKQKLDRRVVSEIKRRGGTYEQQYRLSLKSEKELRDPKDRRSGMVSSVIYLLGRLVYIAQNAGIVSNQYPERIRTATGNWLADFTAINVPESDYGLTPDEITRMREDLEEGLKRVEDAVASRVVEIQKPAVVEIAKHSVARKPGRRSETRVPLSKALRENSHLKFTNPEALDEMQKRLLRGDGRWIIAIDGQTPYETTQGAGKTELWTWLRAQKEAWGADVFSEMAFVEGEKELADLHREVLLEAEILYPGFKILFPREREALWNSPEKSQNLLDGIERAMAKKQSKFSSLVPKDNGNDLRDGIEMILRNPRDDFAFMRDYLAGMKRRITFFIANRSHPFARDYIQKSQDFPLNGLVFVKVVLNQDGTRSLDIQYESSAPDNAGKPAETASTQPATGNVVAPAPVAPAVAGTPGTAVTKTERAETRLNTAVVTAVATATLLAGAAQGQTTRPVIPGTPRAPFSQVALAGGAKTPATKQPVDEAARLLEIMDAKSYGAGRDTSKDKFSIDDVRNALQDSMRVMAEVMPEIVLEGGGVLILKPLAAVDSVQFTTDPEKCPLLGFMDFDPNRTPAAVMYLNPEELNRLIDTPNDLKVLLFGIYLQEAFHALDAKTAFQGKGPYEYGDLSFVGSNEYRGHKAQANAMEALGQRLRWEGMGSQLHRYIAADQWAARHFQDRGPNGKAYQGLLSRIYTQQIDKVFFKSGRLADPLWFGLQEFERLLGVRGLLTPGNRIEFLDAQVERANGRKTGLVTVSCRVTSDGEERLFPLKLKLWSGKEISENDPPDMCRMASAGSGIPEGTDLLPSGEGLIYIPPAGDQADPGATDRSEMRKAEPTAKAMDEALLAAMRGPAVGLELGAFAKSMQAALESREDLRPQDVKKIHEKIMNLLSAEQREILSKKKMNEMRALLGVVKEVPAAVTVVAFLVGGILDLSNDSPEAAALALAHLAQAIGGDATVALKEAFLNTYGAEKFQTLVSDQHGLVIDILEGIPEKGKLEAVKAMLALNPKLYYRLIIRGSRNMEARVKELERSLVKWGEDRKLADIQSRIQVAVASRALATQVNNLFGQALSKAAISSFVVTGKTAVLEEIREVLRAGAKPVARGEEITKDLDGVCTVEAVKLSQDIDTGGAIKKSENGYFYVYDILVATVKSITAAIQGFINISQAA